MDEDWGLLLISEQQQAEQKGYFTEEEFNCKSSSCTACSQPSSTAPAPPQLPGLSKRPWSGEGKQQIQFLTSNVRPGPCCKGTAELSIAGGNSGSGEEANEGKGRRTKELQQRSGGKPPGTGSKELFNSSCSILSCSASASACRRNRLYSQAVC